MSDYIRCYIGDLNYITCKDIQRESGKFDEWELIKGSDFSLKESYSYQGVFEKDEVLLDAIAKRSIVAETRQPEKVKKSIIWSNVLNIADVVTLISLARAKYYPTLAVEKSLGETHSISWGIITTEDPGNHDIISIDKLGNFVSEALDNIENNSKYLKDTGFFPSIFWYAQAQSSFSNSPTVLEMALYWISLEIISSVFINNKCMAITNKKERVKTYLNERGYLDGIWIFVDEVINDWYDVRNSAFHEGEQAFGSDKLKILRQQVRDFTSLVFVEIMQRQDEVRKAKLAKRIREYAFS